MASSAKLEKFRLRLAYLESNQVSINKWAPEEPTVNFEEVGLFSRTAIAADFVLQGGCRNCLKYKGTKILPSCVRRGITCQNCRNRHVPCNYKMDYLFDSTKLEFFAERREFEEAHDLVLPPKISSAVPTQASSSVRIDVSMPDASTPAPSVPGRFIFLRGISMVLQCQNLKQTPAFNMISTGSVPGPENLEAMSHAQLLDLVHIQRDHIARYSGVIIRGFLPSRPYFC